MPRTNPDSCWTRPLGAREEKPDFRANFRGFGGLAHGSGAVPGVRASRMSDIGVSWSPFRGFREYVTVWHGTHGRYVDSIRERGLVPFRDQLVWVTVIERDAVKFASQRVAVMRVAAGWHNAGLVVMARVPADRVRPDPHVDPIDPGRSGSLAPGFRAVDRVHPGEIVGVRAMTFPLLDDPDVLRVFEEGDYDRWAGNIMTPGWASGGCAPAGVRVGAPVS